MKKYLFSLICLSMLTFSCTDMDEDTTGQMVSSDFYSDASLISKAVGAAYSELQSYQNHWGVWGLNTVSSDECVVPTRVPGNDWYDNGNWQAFHRQNWSPRLDALNTNVWIPLFSGITTCNRVVNDLDNFKEEMDIDTYNKFRAEVITLRSFYYFLVLDLFGNVPYVDTYTDDVTTYPQITRSELFDHIVKAIEENISYLDASPNSENYGRCTQPMANVLLAKLYLNAKVYKGESSFSTSDMNKVIEYTDKVINSGNYEIVSNFSEPFKVKNENCHENIFVIPFQNGINKNGDYQFHFHKFSGHTNFRQIYGLNTGGWNGGCATKSFLDLYDDSDIRKRATFNWGIQHVYGTDQTIPNNDNGGLPLEFTQEVGSIEAATKWAGARIQKYEYEVGMSGNMNNDFVLFRLADVYYMKAEAILRGGNGSLASLLADPQFQLIRERADQPVYTTSTLTLDELINERGRELAWEGWRRNDLVRFDKFSKGSWDFKEAFADNHRDIFPIPYEQITKNQSWTQNPGY